MAEGNNGRFAIIIVRTISPREFVRFEEIVMSTIGYGYGSEWHLLRYLGYHREYLSQRILETTGGNALHWLDFKFSPANVPLKDDGELSGLEFITDESVRENWKTFWPPRGNAQNWDAVARIQVNGTGEWLLVEAKSHLGEIKSSCAAKNPKSLQTILAALQATSHTFSRQPKPIENWLTPFYQYANRLAVLHFLMRECQPAIKARLLFIYFYGENRENAQCPQNEQEWRTAIFQINEWLGVEKSSALADRIHTLFLPVNPLGKRPRLFTT
jgi:hypothetical protein